MKPIDLLPQCVRVRQRRIRVAGIYMIFCQVSGKAYIGSSHGVYQRLSEHKAMLNGNKHQNPKFQNAYNKYGAGSFSFLLIERMESSSTDAMLVARENHYLEGCEREYLLNTQIPATVGGSTDFRHSDEVRARISATLRNKYANGYSAPMKGRSLSEERKAEISNFMKGHNFNTEEVKAKIGAAHKGHKRCVGMGNPNATLTEEDVYAIRKLLAEGKLSQEKIAQMFGVNQGAISSIKRRKAWSSLPEK